MKIKTNTYESMVLLDNREVRRGWETLKNNVTSLFTKHDAKVLSARRWQEARLAYPIRGQQRGTYLLVYFQSPTDQLSGIRRDLEYDETVLRYLTFAVDDVPESAYDPEEEFDESEVKVEEISQPAQSAAEEGSSDKKSGDAEASSSDDKAKADDAKLDDAKPDDAKAEDAKPDDAKAEEAPADETKAGETVPEASADDTAATDDNDKKEDV